MNAVTAESPSDGSLSREDALDVLQRQAEVLGMIAEGADLAPTLADIVVALEDLMPGARCSILLFNPATATLHHGAAPHLPEDYIAAIDGMSVGAKAGSCGTAAYTGAVVLAEDITSDERWDDFRSFALPHGLRSCWSTPIRGRSGITGTFAVYHDESHLPTPRERLLVDRFTHLASVAIDHARLFGELHQSEERFRHAFEDNAIGMALVDLEGCFVKVNRALRDMLRRSEADMLGLNFDSLVSPSGRDQHVTSPLRDVTSGAVDRVQFAGTARTPHGRRIELTVEATVIRGPGGKPVNLAVNLVDVTHRRAAEAERRARREAEVARRVAESASRNKSDFVAAMSHDIRTPLQAIAGFTEMLRSMDLPAERRQTALEHIGHATSHITDLVNDVLDIARIEAGSLPVRLSDVDLDRLLREVLDIVGPLAEERSVSLRYTRTIANVQADDRRLRQVLINLLTNGIVYNWPQGLVTVVVEPAESDVAIRVVNTGPGIPTDMVDRLFVPFDRLGADERGVPGVGLGLTLALGLTEAMGGTLRLTSRPDEGATVELQLPRPRPESSHGAEADPVEPHDPGVHHSVQTNDDWS